MIKLVTYILIGFLFSCNKKAYLFSSFNEPANEGLQMLYSYDAMHWKKIDKVLLKPTIGKEKIIRDPSMVQDKYGTFHLVYTTEWRGGNGFGYAKSKDLVNWEMVKYVPVMHNDTSVVNVWAPELYYDKTNNEFTIVWASTIPYKFEKGIEDEMNNHRLYYTTTNDFIHFKDPQLFVDFGYSSIDATIVKRATNDFVLVFKDNTRPERNIKVAFAKSSTGPWQNVSVPITTKFTEGPTVVKTKKGWIIYYDAYQEKKYSALLTQDFKTFSNAENEITIPLHHKHGTIVSVKKKVIKNLIKNTQVK
jgi:predicted GH43/DUF377 family glycosyl hydrolase